MKLPIPTLESHDDDQGGYDYEQCIAIEEDAWFQGIFQRMCGLLEANVMLSLTPGATNTEMVWFTNTHTHTHMGIAKKDYLANTCSHLHIMKF